MKKFINYRPALFCAVFLLTAVLSSYIIFIKGFVALGIVVFSCAFILLVLATISICALNGKYKLITAIIFSFIALIIAVVGFIRFYMIIDGYVKAGLGDVNLTVNGKVETIESFGERKGVVLSSVEFSGIKNGSNGYKILLSVYGEINFDVGDVISFYTVVQDKPLIYEKKFCAADVERAIRYYASVNSSEITVIKNKSNVFDKVNVAIRNVLLKGLDDDEFAVAYALILGNSEYSDSDVLSSYRQAGVAHIFAVSGLHIGFLAAVLGFVLRKTKINPYISAALICSLLFFYSGVCGFSASSLRAAVMCAISLFITAAGGRYDGLTSVSMAAILIIIFSPVQTFCPGFILSFAVVTGIILVAKPIAKIFGFLPDVAANTVGAVLGAWLFSAPILIIFFGELSLFALISNLVFIPVVGAIYVFIILSVILSLIFSPTVFMFLPNAILFAVNYAVNILDYRPFIISGIMLSAFTIFYYIALIIPSGLLNLNKLTKTVVSVLFAAVFLTLTVAQSVEYKETVKAYCTGSYGLSAVVIESKDERAVVICNAEKGFPVNGISRIYRNNGEKTTDVVILSGLDVNLVITRLNALSYIRSVYYFSEDDGEEKVYENSFKKTDFKIVGKEKILFSRFTVELKEKGRAAELSSGKSVMLAFGNFGNKSADFEYSGENYDLIVAGDYLERISAAYNYETFVSFRNSLVYLNAERSGIFLFKFAR